MKHTVCKKVKFCAAHRLYGYNGRCNFLHGHNYVVEVEVSCDPGGLGMVVDFGTIKRDAQGWLDAEWDHTLILNERDPWCTLIADTKKTIMPCNPTAESMAAILLDTWAVSFSWGKHLVAVRVWETDTSVAEARCTK